MVEPLRTAEDAGLIRIGAGMAGSDHGCPAHDGAKVRPRLRPPPGARTRPARLTEFTLKPVMQALDRVEFDGVDASVVCQELKLPDERTHPGLAQYAGQALTNYLAATDVDGSVLNPVRDLWVVQSRSAAIWELYAWGRRYESPDGALREFRFLRLGSQPPRARSEAQVAIAAFAAAFGYPAPHPSPWSDQFQLNSAATPREIRVAEIDLVAGSHHLLFHGSPEEARQYFDSHARAEVARLVKGGEPEPGPACGDCKQLAGCDAVPRIPGLLGLQAERAPRRTMSITDLRYHRKCPAQAHLRKLHLPTTAEYSDEATLGQAVHAWLETKHRSGGWCRAADLPSGDDWSAGRWSVTGEFASRGRDMISAHRQTCPLQHEHMVTDVRVEPLLVVHDPAAEVVVMAKPDMLYVDDGVLVWRELKTTTDQYRFTYSRDLLDEAPQLALAVLLMASGALGRPAAESRVELEVLRADRADLLLVDPSDPERIVKAREVIRGYAAPWRLDETFSARPGKNCRWCPVSKWCPSFPGAAALDAME